MSYAARTVSEAMKRLSCRDPSLNMIDLTDKQHSDAELAELVDCLLAHPDVVMTGSLGGNQLTDETGVKLARYVAAGSTIETLDLSINQLGTATYLAVAAALRVNSSLQYLDLFGNSAVDRTRIDAAFVETLRLNPDRPAWSMWLLYSGDFSDVDFKRLKHAAEQRGHPTLQALLALMC